MQNDLENDLKIPGVGPLWESGDPVLSTRRTGRNPEEVAAKMAAVQGYSDVIFLRDGNLSCYFLY